MYGYGFLSGGKGSGVKLRMLFDYCWGGASAILVNFGSRWVTAGALLPECTHRRTSATWRLPGRLGGQSELEAAASRKGQIPLRYPGRRPAASWNLAYHALSSSLAASYRSATSLGPVCDQDSVTEFGFNAVWWDLRLASPYDALVVI